MPRRLPPTIMREIPAATAAMIERRTDDLVRACMFESNIIRAIVLSVYGQGLMDGVELGNAKPELATALFGPTTIPNTNEVPID